MKNLIQICLALWLASIAAAQESPTQTPVRQEQQKTLRVYEWKDLQAQQKPPGSEIIQMAGISVLKIENTNNSLVEVSLLKISDPSVIRKANRLYGELKCEDVASGSAIDLFSRIPPAASGGDEITAKQSGAYLGGTSNWRPYHFIFVSVGRRAVDGTPIFPAQLEIRLSLAGRGTVYLRPIRLMGTVNNSNSWWSPQQAGLFGGIGGSLIGCLGGLIGWLVSKGRARNFVLAAVKCFIALGILLTVAGLVAAVLQQPYAVWYALLLPGVILVLVFSLNLHSIQRRYDELEIRRMTSIDATGS